MKGLAMTNNVRRLACGVNREKRGKSTEAFTMDGLP